MKFKYGDLVKITREGLHEAVEASVYGHSGDGMYRVWLHSIWNSPPQSGLFLESELELVNILGDKVNVQGTS